MKHTSLLLLTLALAICGCETTDNSSSGSAPKDSPPKTQAKNTDKLPEKGMTKAQILEMYGKTDNIQSTSDGETWVYNLNMGEAFIPFNFGYRPKMRIIDFDKNGIVAAWRTTQ